MSCWVNIQLGLRYFELWVNFHTGNRTAHRRVWQMMINLCKYIKYTRVGNYRCPPTSLPVSSTSTHWPNKHSVTHCSSGGWWPKCSYVLIQQRAALTSTNKTVSVKMSATFSHSRHKETTVCHVYFKSSIMFSSLWLCRVYLLVTNKQRQGKQTVICKSKEEIIIVNKRKCPCDITLIEADKQASSDIFLWAFVRADTFCGANGKCGLYIASLFIHFLTSNGKCWLCL